jgi:response regulator RpfG family c-di-GMP phosphodiesterase
MTEIPHKSTILVVDDTPENIEVLSEILTPDYTVKAAVRAEAALKIIASGEGIDLILLDVMMPGTDGYALCAKLKADPKTHDLPIIFVTSKSEVDDEAKGLRLGAVDYITKPFHPSIIKARVKTHVQLRRTQEELQKLLKQTLSGSIKVMADVISLFDSEIFDKATRLRAYMKKITEALNLRNAWQYDLAALLSQIGSVAIPEEILAKARKGEALSPEEDASIRKIPEIGADLIKSIPNLEGIANVIRSQLTPGSRKHLASDLSGEDPLLLGAQLLGMTLQFDGLVEAGESPDEALLHIRRESEKYDERLLEALKACLQVRDSKMNARVLDVSEMREGMILDENVTTTSRLLVVKRGAELNGPMLARLQRMAQLSLVKMPIRVLIPEK